MLLLLLVALVRRGVLTKKQSSQHYRLFLANIPIGENSSRNGGYVYEHSVHFEYKYSHNLSSLPDDLESKIVLGELDRVLQTFTKLNVNVILVVNRVRVEWDFEAGGGWVGDLKCNYRSTPSTRMIGINSFMRTCYIMTALYMQNAVEIIIAAIA